MVDISTIRLLESFGRFRRGLNLTFSQALKEIGLGIKQGQFLRYLEKNGRASQADLSRATLTDPAAVNRALDSLEKKGWVTRADDPWDRRRWAVQLTGEGRKTAKKVDLLYRRLAEKVFSVFSSAEKKNFHFLLHRLIERGLTDEIRKELSE